MWESEAEFPEKFWEKLLEEDLKHASGKVSQPRHPHQAGRRSRCTTD